MFDHNKINQIKEQYPPGTRIELVSMYDPYSPVAPGMIGAVHHVDDAGTLHMRWDNGRTLGIVPEADQFRVLSSPQVYKLYSPISAVYYGPDYENDNGFGCPEKEFPLSPDNLAGAKKEILKEIKKWLTSSEKVRGLLYKYNTDLSDPLFQKLKTALPSVELVDGELWGVGIFKLNDALGTSEIQRLKSWWNTQLFDVFDYDFSQVGISCEYGEIFVSFWSKDESWNIYDESELPPNIQQAMPQSPNPGMEMR